jgi:hypothetical protein
VRIDRQPLQGGGQFVQLWQAGSGEEDVAARAQSRCTGAPDGQPRLGVSSAAVHLPVLGWQWRSGERYVFASLSLPVVGGPGGRYVGSTI